MFSVQKNGTIKLPKGDTLMQKVSLWGAKYPPGTVAVFGVCTKRDTRSFFSKVFPLEDDEVIIYLTNAETRKFPAGEHRWDQRVVTDPEYDENGTVRCDDASDNVLSVFSGTGMPAFVVTGVSVNV